MWRFPSVQIPLLRDIPCKDYTPPIHQAKSKCLSGEPHLCTNHDSNLSTFTGGGGIIPRHCSNPSPAGHMRIPMSPLMPGNETNLAAGCPAHVTAAAQLSTHPEVVLSWWSHYTLTQTAHKRRYLQGSLTTPTRDGRQGKEQMAALW